MSGGTKANRRQNTAYDTRDKQLNVNTIATIRIQIECFLVNGSGDGLDGLVCVDDWFFELDLIPFFLIGLTDWIVVIVSVSVSLISSVREADLRSFIVGLFVVIYSCGWDLPLFFLFVKYFFTGLENQFFCYFVFL